MHNIGEEIRNQHNRDENRSPESIQSTPQINNVSEQLPNQIN